MTAHDHARVAVEDSATGGVELVPAQRVGAGMWLLLRSPLYALRLAAGDTIRVDDSESGSFEILAHGGNVAVHFYLPENDLDDLQATKSLGSKITPAVIDLGGRSDGQTAGLIVYTIPVEAGFPAIERVFALAVEQFPGAQWEYTNVFDRTTGQPLRWWE